MKIVIVGGGFAGCSAAIEAKKLGYDVTLLEKTDMILGTGLVGGIMRNNGRFTAQEEMINMGGRELFDIIDDTYIHKNINFPGHDHASLFDVNKLQKKVFDYIKKINVDLKLKSRVSKVNIKDKNIISIFTDDGNEYFGDVFIDCTGSAGPMSNCNKYGNGCAMCVLRCPTFKGRISLTTLCGVEEYDAIKSDGSIGSMSGSIKILKDSLSTNIKNKLNREGVCIIKIPEHLKENHLNLKACQQYALKEFKDNLVLLDTGCAKIMTPYYALDKLKQIEGLENIKILDPYSGGIGNSMRFFSFPKLEKTLKVKNIKNLFCAGEKVGILVGHTEAIITGIISAYNSIQFLENKNLIELPRESMIGETLFYVNEKISNGIFNEKFTFSGSVLFEHLKSLNLYELDKIKIKERIKKINLYNIF